MSLRESKQLRQESPVRATPAKVKKSLYDLPEEIIIKIANHISRDFDLVAFSHANLRTFQIISKASLIWKQRLDPEDQNYCLKMKSEFGSQELSCPEKEMFFRRSNSERNMRKAKFNIIDDQFIYDVNMKLYSSLSVYYRDFYVHHWYNPEHMNFTWVDLSKKGGLIQTGILSRKIPDILGGLSFVFAASKSILIVEINGSEYCPPFQHSLFAVDISSRDNLRILWEQNSKSNVKYDVKVANFKIYKLEMNPDSSIVLSILSAETGQTLSIWPFEKNIIRVQIDRSTGRREVSEIIRWLPAMVTEQTMSGQVVHSSINLDLENQTSNRREEIDFAYEIFDNRGKTITMKRTRRTEGVTYTILNVKYCGVTPQLLLMKDEEMATSTCPEVACDAFVLAYLNDEMDGVYLSVSPFQTGSEACKEIKKLIVDIYAESRSSHEEREFFFCTNASKALIVIDDSPEIRFVLLDFNL